MTAYGYVPVSTDAETRDADLAAPGVVGQGVVSRLDGTTGLSLASPERSLDAETDGAARAFRRLLAERYPVRDVFVFGSRARGTHTPESDVDLAVVLKGRPGDRYKAVRDLGDAAYDAMVETGLYVSPLPVWESEFEQAASFSNPALIDTIKREGLRL